MRVATLEIDILTGAVDANLAAVMAGVRAAAEAGAQLVAVPEMWPTSFVPGASAQDLRESVAAVESLAQLAGELGIVVVGSAFGPVGGEAPLPSNRAHVLGEGRVLAFHDKVHLFSPTAEHLAFRAGDDPPPVVELPGSDVRLAPIICYDLRFPEVARAAFRRGAEILVVVAQWPESRAPHWRALLRGRAAELEGFVVASNRIGTAEIGRRRMKLNFVGDAAVVGPGGEDVPRTLASTIGRGGSRLSVHEIDVEEARALRRAVPVLRDDRPELFPGWIGS
ncbi:carbon-nitrogen hydrolase family protein [Saltatorellus ferox]